MPLRITTFALVIVSIRGECLNQEEIDQRSGWTAKLALAKHAPRPERDDAPWEFTAAEREAARAVLNKGPQDPLTHDDFAHAMHICDVQSWSRRKNPLDYHGKEISTEMSTFDVENGIATSVVFPCSGNHQCDNSEKEKLKDCHRKAYTRVKGVLDYLTDKSWADLPVLHKKLVTWYFGASEEGVFPGGMGKVQKIGDVLVDQTKETKILTSIRHQLRFVLEGIIGGDYEADAPGNGGVFGFAMRGRTHYNCEYWPFRMKQCKW